ncbi:MAG: FAD binding domain-containing protein [Bacillota bacterium]
MVSHIHPNTLQEALKHLEEEPCHIVAGGTDLWVKHRNWANTPPKFDQSLLYIAHLDTLLGIREESDMLDIGAMTPYETILNHPATPKMLKACLFELASPAIRHVATLAGNIANASPAADAVLVLIALDASVEIESANKKKFEKVKDVITGPGKTTLKQGDMITRIMIPLNTFTHKLFKKVGGRKADAISKIAFAGGARVREGNLEDLNIALGAVNITVVRDEPLENKYIGKPVSTLKNQKNAFLDELSASIKPIDDQRSNALYRKQVALNLVSNFIDSL